MWLRKINNMIYDQYLIILNLFLVCLILSLYNFLIFLYVYMYPETFASMTYLVFVKKKALNLFISDAHLIFFYIKVLNLIC